MWPTSFDSAAPAVGANIVLAAFAARAGDYELLVVFRSAGAVVISSLIVIVSVHGLNAEDAVVASKGRVGSCRPAPADVDIGNVARECATDRYRLDVGRKAGGRHRPRGAREETLVVEVPGNSSEPYVVDGVEAR
jgi:hypothetical protein